ncbi:MAG: phosphoribosylformylglycinamidine synthase subunit PurQ [Bacteroidia bacterium]
MGTETYSLSVAKYRDIWYETSVLLDRNQTANGLALMYVIKTIISSRLPISFQTIIQVKKPVRPTKRPKAAVLREKGSNSERELANALYLAGFDVKDVHMTDLITGRKSGRNSVSGCSRWILQFTYWAQPKGGWCVSLQ